MYSASAPIPAPKNESASPRRVFPILLVLLFSVGCVKEPRPANIPEGAKFDKNFNSYVLTETGRRRIYYDNGNIYQDCTINELGLDHGLCRIYSKYDGRVLAEGKLDNSVRRGTWVWRFDDGKVYIRQNYGNGPRKPEVMMSGDEGNEDGQYERFYQNGQVELKGKYSEGYRNDLWQRYFPDGELEYTGYYKMGRKIRSWFYYYPTHKTEAIEVYDDNGGFISRTTYLPDGTQNCEIKKGAETVCQSKIIVKR